MDWNIKFLRGIGFEELESLQAECVAAVRADPGHATLLVSEPKATFTHGRTARPQDLLFSPIELSQRKIEVRPVGRGGQWTYHGPGQVVVYPVANLRTLGYRERAVAAFLNDLRIAVAQVLARHRITAEAGERPFGLFHSGRKIVSFGIAAHRNIISHGFAIYKNRQSDPFSGIHPCGVTHGEVVSLEELGVDIEWEPLATQLVEHIKKVLKAPKTR